MKKITTLLLSIIVGSCAPCSLKGLVAEKDVKAQLLRCKGEHFKKTITAPGGPFFERTEIWDYSPASRPGTDAFWFVDGKLVSSPEASQGIHF